MTAQRWEYTVSARCTFGGFEVSLVGDYLFIQAVAWKGSQPRLVIYRNEQGFSDWEPLLTPCRVVVSFDGNEEFAQNLVDQWLTHGNDR